MKSNAFKDGLQLTHWVRDGDQDKEYVYGKFNKSLELLSFTDEEYTKHLVDESWSLPETRLLFELCQRFDLRFVVVHDQFATKMVSTILIHTLVITEDKTHSEYFKYI